jgi:hypothetical protein
MLNREEKRKLTRLVLSTRTHWSGSRVDVPRWIEADDYWLDGVLSKRLRIILRGNGCSKPTCTMCPFPNEGRGHKLRVSGRDLVNQVESSLTAAPSAAVISIYNDGSFFSEAELPRDSRIEICRTVAESGASTLMVESLPQLITQQALGEVIDALRDVRLVVGIGIQSSSALVRESLVNSPVTESAFLDAHRLLAKYGQMTKAYVMIKPPFLAEQEGVVDAAQSVVWLHNQGVQDVALCPTRVVDGTVAWRLHIAGLFQPPRLTSVAEVLRRSRSEGCTPRVSLFNLKSTDLLSVVPAGCGTCEAELLLGFKEYNRDPIGTRLAGLVCRSCQKLAVSSDANWLMELPPGDRVSAFLEFEQRVAKSDSV